MRHLKTFEFICHFKIFSTLEGKCNTSHKIEISKHGYLIFRLSSESKEEIITFSCNGELIASAPFSVPFKAVALDNTHDYLVSQGSNPST